MSLLVRKVNKLRYILEISALFAEAIHSALGAMDDKSRLFEGVDIAIYRAVRNSESLRNLIDGVADISRHHLHQSQYAFNFRLVHTYLYIVCNSHIGRNLALPNATRISQS